MTIMKSDYMRHIPGQIVHSVVKRDH